MQTNVEYASEQNLAERGHVVIMDAARAMIQHAKLPKCFLADAILTATHVLNLCPHPAEKNMTPYQILKKSALDLNYIRIFGCDAYAHIPRSKRTKAEPKAKKYIFIGYSDRQKGYKLYDPVTRSVSVHRDVTFNEVSFGNRLASDAFSEGTDVGGNDSETLNKHWISTSRTTRLMRMMRRMMKPATTITQLTAMTSLRSMTSR